MRFIEFMPLDADRHWTRSLVVPAAEVHQRIHARWPLEQIPHEHSETARKYRFADGAPGEIGLIAPVTQPFCGHCSRIRLTADGKLRTCLFSKDDHDLRSLLREGASDEDLVTYIRSIVTEKRRGIESMSRVSYPLAHDGIHWRVVENWLKYEKMKLPSRDQGPLSINL